MEIYKLNKTQLRGVKFDEYIKDDSGKFMIILNPDELGKYNNYFKFHETTVNECISPKQHPRLEVYDDIYFGVLNIIKKGNVKFNLSELDFYLTASSVFFITHEDSKLIEKVKQEVNKIYASSSVSSITPCKILYIMLDKLTSMDNVILKEIEKKIADLEERVMEGKETKEYEITKEIITLRKRLLFLKRYYEPLLDIADDLVENENGLIEEANLKFYRMLFNRIDRLNHNVYNLRDYVTQVREAYQAQVDINLNKTMKFFTIITTIFLPLTLIAGWYGMNFKYMPELNWKFGYLYVIGLSVLVVVLSIAAFKKNKML